MGQEDCFRLEEPKTIGQPNDIRIFGSQIFKFWGQLEKLKWELGLAKDCPMSSLLKMLTALWLCVRMVLLLREICLGEMRYLTYF